MTKLKIEYFGTLGDISNRTDLTLLTDSQEVEAVKENLAGTDKRTKNRRNLDEYILFMVKVEEGEYTEIYGSPSSVAWDNSIIDKITVER